MKTFDQIYHKVIQNLERGLPEWLTYHNVNHTLYVLEQAQKIALYEQVNDRDLLLVKIAALYHDSGFLVNRKDHENIGCSIASKDLSSTDLEPSEIKKICGMIQATHIPQQPETLPEKIVADADLEYLGTDNFEDFGNKLYREILHSRPELTILEWDKIQIDFLSKHHYHTAFCKKYKEPVKQKNLELIKQRLLAHKK